jgi:hypothetical protein
LRHVLPNSRAQAAVEVAGNRNDACPLFALLLLRSLTARNGEEHDRARVVGLR